MTNEQLLKELEQWYRKLKTNGLFSDKDVETLDAVEALIDSEESAWTMLEEMKSSEISAHSQGETRAIQAGFKPTTLVN